MENLEFSLNIVLPMACLLAFGYIFAKTGFFSKEFIANGKKFCFYCLLSSSLFKNLYDSSLDYFPVKLVEFVVIAIVAEFIISFFIAKKIAQKTDQIGVIIQGVVRSNFAYIGIPLATMMFEDEKLIALTRSEASMISIFVVPLFNIFSVLALTYHSDKKDDKGMISRTLLSIIKNPCIISIMLGLAVLVFRGMVPSRAFYIRDELPFLYKVLNYLSSMSTPLAFILVGAGLDFSHSISNLKNLLIVVLLKTLIYPGVILYLAYCTKSFIGADFAVMVSTFGSPTAVASAIMATELGGDEELASEIVAYTTIFSIFSLLLIIFSLKEMGCL